MSQLDRELKYARAVEDGYYAGNLAFITSAVMGLAEAERKQGIKDALGEARQVITQYLCTAEKWRYDRVCWAFAIMLGEIPEDTPMPKYRENPLEDG